MKITIFAAAFGLLLASCQPSGDAAAQPQGGTAASLSEADEALSKAVAAKDRDGILAFYAEDAVLLPTAEPRVEGKAAIAEEWKHILAIPDFTNVSKRLGTNVATGGDMGYTWGSYVATMMGEDGKPVEEPGKWISIWRHDPDAGWRIVMETYNTDIPPPDHK